MRRTRRAARNAGSCIEVACTHRICRALTSGSRARCGVITISIACSLWLVAIEIAHGDHFRPRATRVASDSPPRPLRLILRGHSTAFGPNHSYETGGAPFRSTMCEPARCQCTVARYRPCVAAAKCCSLRTGSSCSRGPRSTFVAQPVQTIHARIVTRLSARSSASRRRPSGVRRRSRETSIRLAPRG